MPRRPDPLKELLDLQERMNRLFDETLSRERPDEMDTWAPSWVPLADVYDTPEAYLVEIELPGLARADIDIQLKGRELVVRGERHPAGGRSAAFHRLERRYGLFARAFRFDVDIDPERVHAEMQDGLLSLNVPKVRPRATKRVIKATRSS
jgi:HSP20 family protein